MRLVAIEKFTTFIPDGRDFNSGSRVKLPNKITLLIYIEISVQMTVYSLRKNLPSFPKVIVLLSTVNFLIYSFVISSRAFSRSTSDTGACSSGVRTRVVLIVSPLLTSRRVGAFIFARVSSLTVFQIRMRKKLGFTFRESLKAEAVLTLASNFIHPKYALSYSTFRSPAPPRVFIE